MIPTPKRNRSGKVRQLPPSNELFQQIACGYILSEIHTLCPIRSTPLFSPLTRPLIEDFPMFRILDTHDLNILLDTYEHAELNDIVAKVISIIETQYNSDPSQLDKYLQLFFDHEDRLVTRPSTPPPASAPAPYRINPNLFSTFSLSGSTPIASTSHLALLHRFYR